MGSRALLNREGESESTRRIERGRPRPGESCPLSGDRSGNGQVGEDVRPERWLPRDVLQFNDPIPTDESMMRAPRRCS